MTEIQDLAKIRDKYARVAPTRVTDFAEGIQNPRRSWEQSTKAASDAYAQGVQQAIGEGRFETGVAKAGDAKWQRKTQDVGVQRWAPGIQASLQDYETGFAPFHAVIARTTLPPRGPKGDPRNIERVAVLARALNAAKVGGA